MFLPLEGDIITVPVWCLPATFYFRPSIFFKWYTRGFQLYTQDFSVGGGRDGVIGGGGGGGGVEA